MALRTTQQQINAIIPIFPKEIVADLLEENGDIIVSSAVRLGFMSVRELIGGGYGGYGGYGYGGGGGGGGGYGDGYGYGGGGYGYGYGDQ